MRSIKEKKERALGTKLFIKAERCSSPKCAIIRKPYKPGIHINKSRNISEYGSQLKEKQKFQIIYGLNNHKAKNLFQKYSKNKIITMMEKRLDRVVYLLGLAKSTRIARQLVSHGHIMVNQKKVTTPSFLIKVGDVIEVRTKSLESKVFSDLDTYLKHYICPKWLELEPKTLKGKCVSEPTIEALPFNIDRVGEFFSR